MQAALGHLRLHYAARLAGLLLCRRTDQSAAIAALEQERDTALDALASRLHRAKEQALRDVRQAARRRFRATPPPRMTLMPPPAPRQPGYSSRWKAVH
jgi:hypothetical protein